jgi:NADH:ubiquinone oxidoreductase subunit F (NADH-binding)/(2Fe-2S) ferredoxin/NAD-dependent dihydropyrimidine dehydrogenase PreA subunit
MPIETMKMTAMKEAHARRLGMIKKRVIICAGTGCVSNGSMKVFEAFESSIKEQGLDVVIEFRQEDAPRDVYISKSGCQGFCQMGPLVTIQPGNIFYTKVKPRDVAEIVEKTIKNDDVITRLLYLDPNSRKHVPSKEENAFYLKQNRVVIGHCGFIDPESIDEYVMVEGYTALVKALEMGPEKIIAEIKSSGLRGRGGAGFSTGLKWDITRKAPGALKYVICNGDEGDPGAYMDRSILEGDPHAIIEGMGIAAIAMGASKGYFYIRAEYPLAVERVEKAIRQARAGGFLGKNILGSGFDLDLEIRLGAGAFVCGEETALIASIEGERGYPRPRPPFPSISGLWGKPTCINNVETLASVPKIINQGAAWFSAMGTEKSKGTKVFALTGKVKNSGLIEVPMGTTIREIVFEIGGGILKNRQVKAIQTGGPSGGVLPEKYFDTPVGYEELQNLGSIMGSGGMIAMDETDCVVDIAKFYLEFCVDESCGKCAPCRIGGKQMLTILRRISNGQGSMEDLETLERIASAMQRASLCGLGQTAPNPVLSTLKYFREEYETHVIDKKCPAGKCKALCNYEIDQSTCKKCGVCLRNCPAGAIVGSREEGFKIIEAKCVRCGQCFDVCKLDSVRIG